MRLPERRARRLKSRGQPTRKFRDNKPVVFIMGFHRIPPYALPSMLWNQRPSQSTNNRLKMSYDSYGPWIYQIVNEFA
jgi:hypothetical protein